MIKASYSKHTLIFKQPAGTSRGVLTKRDIFYLVLFEKKTNTLRGIGEIAPIPGLSPDPITELELKIKTITQKINSGEKPDKTEFNNFPSVKFGYEMAYLGLNSKSPTILFPSDFTSAKKGIPINGLIWMGSKNFMLAQITEKLSAGYKCLKLKIGAIDFSSEIEIIKSIRTKFTPDQLEIRVDANGAFDPGNAQKKLEILAKFNLHSIEQPIKQGQIGEMQKLCKNTPLPIALDEELIGIYDYAEKKNLLKTINPQYIILKPTLTGGFKASEEWIDLAKKQNITWWVTSALESNIGLNAIAQWTAKLGTSNYQGLGTGSLYTNNISSPLFVENGYIQHDSNNIWKLGKIIKDITF